MKRLIQKLKLGTKLNILMAAVLIGFSIVVGFITFDQIKKGVEETAVEKAVSDLNLGYEYINSEYPGEWRIEDGNLIKGETTISGNTDIVDFVGEMTGGTVTIFMNDTRVTTNVMLDGERAVGTQASDEVVETVLQDEAMYTGEADVVGTSYQTAYEPIYNEVGEPIGMWYVGASQEILDEITGNALITFLIALVITGIAAMGSVFLFSRRVSKRLGHVTGALTAAGQGDFTTELSDPSDDEIGRLTAGYNQMRENLNALVKQILETSEQVAASSEQFSASAEETSSAADEVSRAVQEVSSGAENQAQSMGETKSLVAEISGGMDRISGNIHAINETSSINVKTAENGSRVIQHTLGQMSLIQDKTNYTAKFIHQLENKSGQINDIISLITNIANQTNLLALNAAIEAARAGESGQGFAVVAEEVRKLAEQSGSSASQIGSLIKDIQADIQESVTSMEDGKEAVEGGIRQVKEAESAFQSISVSTKDIAVQLEESSAAVEQMTAQTEALMHSVQAVADIADQSMEHTQNVAASSEEQNASMQEISSASSTLAHMAEELGQSVRSFKV
ncbi:methyl-accepting chemotaxis protein [Marinococcus luteus]|uniref:methyl-accepting chemotaxis protein n=1 Tax=Marinococcus luteus TaxID=1122204 RepID=UPI002ACC6408|nr:methyl-accepting chemotaxis protein [Marinococcus luteus]MDZ5783873.1 methyl-accepting chemotaxis protein [Marinococcus luteus]